LKPFWRARGPGMPRTPLIVRTLFGRNFSTNTCALHRYAMHRCRELSSLWRGDPGLQRVPAVWRCETCQASYIRTMEQVLSVTCTCSDRACAVWRFVLRCLVQTFHERFFRNMCKYLSHTYAHTCTYLFACMLAFQIKMKMLPPRCKDSKTIKWVTSQSMKSSDVGEVEKHLCGWNWNPLYIYMYICINGQSPLPKWLGNQTDAWISAASHTSLSWQCRGRWHCVTVN
jgi:hypothetical protein